MNSTFRLGARGKFRSAARDWSRFTLVGLLAVVLAVPIYAAKGGGGKGGGKGGGGGDTGGTSTSGAVPEGHFQWRVPLAGPYSAVRPVVGSDGTIYVVDVYDNLHAIAPDGTERWPAVAQAGSKGLDIGPDGTIYTGNEDWIKAFRPEDGSLKWTFVQSPRAFVLVDVAVGPDGDIYAVASSGMGVFALRDDGASATLRWTNPEAYGRPFKGYAEIAFGPNPGNGDQLYFNANGHTRAVRLGSGTSVFTVGSGNQDPQVSLLDGNWHVGDAAYSPDAQLVWQFQYPAFTTAIQPAVGPSGTHYAVNQGRNLYAINAEGIQRWTSTLAEYVGVPDVSPDETQLLVPAGGTSTGPAALQSASTANGSPGWRMEFPAHPSGNEQFVDTGIAFSNDGGTAYVVTAPAGGGVAFLNAINTDPSIPSASTRLRSTSIATSGRSKGSSVVISGVVTVLDENQGAVSGATVHATWTLPDGSTVDASASTSSAGEAKFSQSGDGGVYWLDITGITRTGYTFDPDHSVLSAGQAWF